MENFGNHMEIGTFHKSKTTYRFRMQEQVKNKAKDKEDQEQWHKTSNS